MEYIVPGFFIGMVAAISLMFVYPVIMTILSFFRPGLSGYIQCQNRRHFEMTKEPELRSRMKKKLKTLRFHVITEKSGQITALREANQLQNRGIIFSLDNLPMKMEMSLNPEYNGVDVSLMLKYKTFIYSDTGESDYIRLLSEYILKDTQVDESPPFIVSTSQSSSQEMFFAFLSLALVLAVFHIRNLPYEEWLYNGTLHAAGWIMVIISLYYHNVRTVEKLTGLTSQDTGSDRKLYTLLMSAGAFLMGFFYLYQETARWPFPELAIYIFLSLIIGKFAQGMGAWNRNAAEALDPELLREKFEKQAAEVSLKTEETPRGETKISVPLGKSRSKAIFLTVWLTGWAFGELLAGLTIFMIFFGILTRGDLPQEMNVMIILFIILWCIGWTFAGYFAIKEWLWNIFARLTLYRDESFLTIEERTGWKSNRKIYDLDRIQHFRIETDPGRQKGNIISSPGIFAFEYQGNTVRFGRGVSHPEALAVKKKLEDIWGQTLGNV